MLDYKTIGACRVCGSTELTDLFGLGAQFVSNFVEQNAIESGPRVPIDIALCRQCSLVQAKHTAPNDFMFSRHYWFRSGVTQTLRDALKDVAEAAQRAVALRPGDVVLDIGANDGTGLRCFDAPGIVRVACEPAANLAEECRVGIDCLIRDFWNYAAYRTALYLDPRTKRWELLPKAKVITACGMFYDLEDPNAFVADVARALAPDGLFVAQIMCLKQMAEKFDVGNLAHEHLSYFSARSLRHLFQAHGLSVVDVEENEVNGGSYRLYVRHRQWAWDHDAEVEAGQIRFVAAEESECHAWPGALPLHDPEFYAAWFDRVCANRDACVRYLRARRAEGKRIWILGASTKGNVIAQWYGFDADMIEAAAERSPEKVGLHMVGTGIPIRSEEDFRRSGADVAVILPYSFAAEIMERERAFRERGGLFVLPLPQFKVV